MSGLISADLRMVWTCPVVTMLMPCHPKERDEFLGRTHGVAALGTGRSMVGPAAHPNGAPLSFRSNSDRGSGLGQWAFHLHGWSARVRAWSPLHAGTHALRCSQDCPP